MAQPRFTATVLLLQGIAPVFFLGIQGSVDWLSIYAAGFYILLSISIWRRQFWATAVALIVTIPQVLIVNSMLVSWRFHVGISFGVGICPSIANLDLFMYSSRGTIFNFALADYHPAITADFGSTDSESFLGINVFAAFVMVCLIGLFVAQRRTMQSLPPRPRTV